tara:strand:- start:50 stop:574 length:525 start_codon:yes stop_codon:yes gene_type:complete
MNPNDPINKSDKMNPGNPVRREKLKQMIEHMDEEKLKIMQEIIMEGLRPSSVPQAMAANIVSDVVDIPDAKTYSVTGPADESDIYEGTKIGYGGRSYLKENHINLAQWLNTIKQWRESGPGGNAPISYRQEFGGTDFPKYVTWTEDQVEQIYETVENTDPAPGEATWTGELVQF